MSPAERYRSVGVDLDTADAAKQRILRLVASTRTSLSRGVAGAFGGMVRVPTDVERPVLVTSTDGVGSKVMVAARAGRHDTVGEDLVNHCVNDILVHGAKPLAFLDYIGGSGLDTAVLTALVDGVAQACRAHGMPLVGGETAQLPDLYQPGYYDLAGTIIGVVGEAEAILGESVRVGDVLVGYTSSGLHTNGYTLARHIVFDVLGLDVNDEIPGLGASVADVLLTVHRSYWRAIGPVLAEVGALAHITGGGIAANLARALPEGCGAVVERGSWPVLPVFQMLQEFGGVTTEEMYRVFNMGLGMIAVATPDSADELRQAASRAGLQTYRVGEVIEGRGVELQ